MGKQKITKEMIIDAAFSLLREGGREAVTVGRISRRLNCSTQPIYSYCSNMDGVWSQVAAKVRDFVEEYCGAHRNTDDLFRSTGHAYAQLAKEEPHLFAFFVTYPRRGICSLEDMYAQEANPEMAAVIADTLHISQEAARRLHLHMLIYTIGLGTLYAASQPGIDGQEVSNQLDSAYAAFRAQAEEKGNQPCHPF